MKLYVIASSSFNNEEQFKEIMQRFTADTYYVKSKSNIANWLPSAEKFDKYTDIVVDDDTKIIVIWDGASLNMKKIIDQYANKTTIIPFENKSTASFHNQIEKIKNEKWKLGCKELAKLLPPYFWVVAASSSGKYHPKCDLGNGGLVRHSIMVATCAVDLVEAEIFVEDNDINKDMALIAGLFHDCLKQGVTCSGHTVFEHPILAADFMKEKLKDYIEEPYLSVICSSVRTHMGKWTTSAYAPDLILDKPSTAFQKLVHTADYIAARKYIAGLEEWK